MRHLHLRLARWTAVAALALMASHAVDAQLPQQVPTPFRASVTLIPIDVRVVDRRGQAVTDLTSSEFSVYENGVRQQIAHFSTRSYIAPDSTAPGRSFAIVLGRGNLGVPAKSIDAVIDFVRSALRPSDNVAVLAFLRLVRFTKDRSGVVRFLDRYKEQHVDIDGRIVVDFTRGCGAPAWPLSEQTQRAMQRFFDAPGLPAMMPFPGSEGGRGLAYHDSVYFTRSLEYLRQIEGEKHLVFLTEFGLGSTGDYYTRRASAARVTVSVIQTGGVRGPRVMPSCNPGVRTARTLSDWPGQVGMFTSQATRSLAEQTGGIAGLYEYAEQPLRRLAQSTSFEYLLGYYPATPPRDGEFRDLRVETGRSGLTVLYRHGYEVRERQAELADARAIFVENRILQVLDRPEDQTGTGAVGFTRWDEVDVSAVMSGDSPSGRQVNVDIAIDPRRVTFAEVGGRFLADLDVAVFARTPERRVAGDHWDRVRLNLQKADYTALMKGKIRRTATISVDRVPKDVKVVVFEYGSDRSAWVTAKVRQAKR